MNNSIASINAQLQREIKNGSKYDKYFDNTPCKPTYLGDGVTSFGLQKIKEWVLKHQDQTKAIAKVLKSNTVPQTVLNIKKFLYDHFQYSADGWEQNLKSPNCAWQTRTAGHDCKTYSLLASSILTNLGIKHKLRKITQPGSPERWSHVFVVVDHNGKELIIDATVPFNYEVSSVLKEDLPMEKQLSYYGLNAAQLAKPMTKKTAEIAAAIDGFQDYLDALEKRGVTKQVTDSIWNEAKNYLDRGIEPKVQVQPTHIIINGKRIDYGVGMNGQGLGFIDPVTVGAASSILDIFSGIFGGKKAEPEVTNRIINPLTKSFQQKLASANESNLHQIVTQIDFELASNIAHEKKVNSRFSAVAIPQLEAMLQAIRQKYASLNPQPTSGAGQFKDNWSGGKTPLVHQGTVTYYQYQPAQGTISTGNPFPTTTTTNTNSKNVLKDLVQLGNGLFMNPKTNQTYTPQQVQQFANTADPFNENGKEGMSTIAIVGIAAVGLGVLYFVAKKQNII